MKGSEEAELYTESWAHIGAGNVSEQSWTEETGEMIFVVQSVLLVSRQLED